MENDEPPVSPRMVSFRVYGFLIVGAVNTVLMRHYSTPFGLPPVTYFLLSFLSLGAVGAAFYVTRPSNSREIADFLRKREGKFVVACFLLGALANLAALCAFVFIR